MRGKPRFRRVGYPFCDRPHACTEDARTVSAQTLNFREIRLTNEQTKCHQPTLSFEGGLKEACVPRDFGCVASECRVGSLRLDGHCQRAATELIAVQLGSFFVCHQKEGDATAMSFQRQDLSRGERMGRQLDD